MPRVWTILGSIFSFGWLGLHLADAYSKTHHWAEFWIVYSLGVGIGAVSGLVVSSVLIWWFSPTRRRIRLRAWWTFDRKVNVGRFVGHVLLFVPITAVLVACAWIADGTPKHPPPSSVPYLTPTGRSVPLSQWTDSELNREVERQKRLAPPRP